MAMVKRSITITEQQATWIKAQVNSGRYGNESEVFRDLIRERVAKEEKTNAIRAALIEGEKSGFQQKSIEEIWKEAETAFRGSGDQAANKS